MFERLAILETKVGDAENGLLGEVNQLRKAMRALELRLASLIAVAQLLQFFLIRK